jgi:hypothetical protein
VNGIAQQIPSWTHPIQQQNRFCSHPRKEGDIMRFKSLLVAGVVAGICAWSGTAGAQEEPAKDRGCILDCRQAYERCSHAAYVEGRMCVEACAEALAAARAICAVAPESEECRQAQRRAAECVRACRQALGEDLRACRADAKECVSLCPDVEPQEPRDPLCLHECRRQVRACLDRANAAARECAAPCRDLIEKAKVICALAPRSEECAEARREASACMRPCRQQLAEQTRQCVADGLSCAASCPPAVEPMEPTRE